MDKLIDSPWFLRFTALFLAIILFFSVKAEEEKTNGKAFGDTLEFIRDIPVVVNYDNENLVVTGIPETVNMTIEGPANIVQTTKLLKDFTIFVDLRSLPMGKHSVRIQHENLSEKLNVRIEPTVVNVVIEEKITQTFRVDPELNERLLADDYIVKKIDVVPPTIEVTGAKSVIDSISFVKASITRDSGINKSFQQQTRVRVLDKDLSKLNVTISPEHVNVKVEIEEYSKEVPIVVQTHGFTETGITIDSVKASEEKIRLFGPRKIVDQIKKYNVNVDVSAIKGNETLDVKLDKPIGINLMSLEKVKVRVNATVLEPVIDTTDPEETGESKEPEESEESEDIVTKEFDNIRVIVRGLDIKFKSTFLKPADGLVDLIITADKDSIDKLDKSDFSVYVDASESADIGNVILPVSVEMPTGLEYKLSIKEIEMHIELA